MYHDYKYKLSGRITFDPIDLTKKHVEQSEWKNSAIVLIDNDDFCEYYAWFINIRYRIYPLKPLRGLHFTIINDKVLDNEKYLEAKEKYNNTIVEIEYSIDPRTDGKHWWLNAKSEDAEAIRISCGLEPKPYWGFHITIGRVHGERRIEHSNYIHDLIKKYGNEYN